jgi:hypothetical protein
LFNQININADGKLKGESKNESFFELQETVGTIVSNLKDTTSKIKSDFNYAYENKYHIKIEFPFQLNQNNNTNSKLLIDNTHFVSSSIPSFSIDVLENKLNNLKRKSGGGITGDSFSVTFRDNADRDYYRFFQLWINSMYATPNWGGDIRLYRYPESYFGKISFFMLHSGGGKNPFGISNNSGGLIGGLNNLANNSAMLPEVYDFREKVYSTVQDGTVDSQNRIMLSQLTEIPYITDTLKTKENTKNNAINHTKNYYITDIISFGRIFPSQLSDIQLNSGSSELQTFDVTFEYTFPVNFSKYNINNGKMEVSFSI